MIQKTNTFLWKNRERDLASVKRYHKFEVMFYRTDLLIHLQRVGAIVENLIPFAQECYEGFDVKKAKLISKFHDDYELVLKGGDIPLQYKLKMSPDELSELEDREVVAAKLIAKKYPKKIEGYNYLDLLMHSIHKDCREAQLHSFADKHDGYNEAIHEVLAGNTIFLEPVINYIAKTFAYKEVKFPLIADLFVMRTMKNIEINPFLDFKVIDLKEYFENGLVGARPDHHIFKGKKTDIPCYEKWKELTLQTFPNGLDLLTKQVEFHRNIKPG